MAEGMIRIYTDGASRGNPGDAAWAYLFVANNSVIHQESGFLGIATNNEAEYHAVIHALRTALMKGYCNAELYSDSELVIKQINCEYQVRKKHLLALIREVRHLQSRFDSLSFFSLPRTHYYIGIADGLCNTVLDHHSRSLQKGKGQ